MVVSLDERHVGGRIQGSISSVQLRLFATNFSRLADLRFLFGLHVRGPPKSCFELVFKDFFNRITLMLVFFMVVLI
ncbi:hypothetical protein RchiOBHm_Chr2g0086351 [Rosa chinensis]|uniref:Uncharacterized protein n=1 Tax=Rosa chinensis TaxID=74649 RepID=A0A2P6RIE8_ROSCH|nr:hypothetical protein RchiOBHm_Chr2g0086351 [Rosa chinensis]